MGSAPTPSRSPNALRSAAHAGNFSKPSKPKVLTDKGSVTFQHAPLLESIALRGAPDVRSICHSQHAADTSDHANAVPPQMLPWAQLESSSIPTIWSRGWRAKLRH